MKGFITFVREQGVVGLAVGFILGGAVAQVISAVVSDLVNPFIGLLLGNVKGLEKMSFQFLGAKFLFGHLFIVLINFITISAVVYFVVKGLKLDKIDYKKEELEKKKN